MPPFVLSCLTYLGVALPGSTLGLLWPSMRVSIHEPVSALGIVLVAGVAASAISSVVTGRIFSRAPAGPLLAGGAALMAAALAMEALAPALWLIAIGSAVFSAGFGTIDAALNAYAAGHFGARQINWMHAGYGLGATIGPLLVTGLLAAGESWRLALAVMAAVIAVITVLLTACRRAWEDIPRPERALTPAPLPRAKRAGSGAPEATRASGKAANGKAANGKAANGKAANGKAARAGQRRVVAGVVFTAVETGVESAAGIWGYVFLTSGRGLPDTVAGVAVSAYWVMMFAGRALLGPVAERAGASRVLAVAVAGVPVGALLMAVPAPAFVAVAGMLLLGLAAAPVFPLLTLTTADRVGAGGATAAVGLQVAAGAVGGAALPSAVGLAIGAVGAPALGPALLVLGLGMCLVYRLTLRPARTLWFDRGAGRRRLEGRGSAAAATIPGARPAHTKLPGFSNTVFTPRCCDDAMIGSDCGSLLVVDDELFLREAVAASLRFLGFGVTSADSGMEALRLARDRSFDLMILDVMLPDVDGFEIVRRLRRDGNLVPVIFLTAKDTRQDKVNGLTIGGDDYVTKPFGLEELAARVRTVLRRTRPAPADPVLSFADLTLDQDTYEVRRDGQLIELSPTEFRLLRYFMLNPGRVLTRAQLLDHVWDYDFGGSGTVVSTYVAYLRRKLATVGPDLIHTQRAVGYSLRLPRPEDTGEPHEELPAEPA